MIFLSFVLCAFFDDD